MATTVKHHFQDLFPADDYLMFLPRSLAGPVFALLLHQRFTEKKNDQVFQVFCNGAVATLARARVA